MPALLFVEGVSGVGKSTIAQKLCNKLQAKGYAVRLFLEQDAANPIDFYSTAYFRPDAYEALLETFYGFADRMTANTIVAGDARLIRYYLGDTPVFAEPLLSILREHEFCYKPAVAVPIEAYMGVCQSVWARFSETMDAAYDFLLFDGSLLHHPLNDMMRNYNACADRICSHINALAASVKPYNPRIIYLSSDNISARLTQARKSRNQALPSDEQIKFWQKRARMDAAVLGQLAIPWDIYDISNGGWDDIPDCVLQKLNI